jgi:hypothetical protein
VVSILAATALAAVPPLDPVPQWRSPLRGEAAPLDLTAADFDGNGALDLAWSEGMGRRVSIAYASTPGVFDPPVQIDPGAEEVTGAWLGAVDLDGDGYADLLTSTVTSGVVGWPGGPAGLQQPAWQLGGTGPITAIGDVDASGVADVAVGLAVWLGGAGGPAAGGLLPGQLVFPYSRPTPIGDLDGDLRADLLVPDHVLAGAYMDGMAGPASAVRLGAPSLWTVDLGLGTAALAVALDLNGDGAAEIVTLDATSADESLWGAIAVLSDLSDPVAPTPLTNTPIDLDIGRGLALAAGDDAAGEPVLLLAHDGEVVEIPWDPVTGLDLAGGRRWGHPSRTVHAVLAIDLDADGLRDLAATFSFEGNEATSNGEVAVWLTGKGVPAPDTGGLAADPADTGGSPADPVGRETPTAHDGGCGCSTSGTAGWPALLVLALLRRPSGLRSRR